MTAPLPILGIGTQTRGDIKRAISFPVSLKEGSSLESRRSNGPLVPRDQIKLNNFIDARGLSQALKRDGSLSAQYTPKEVALVELYEALPKE